MNVNTVPPSPPLPPPPPPPKLESDESLQAKSEEKAFRKVKKSLVDINHLYAHQEFERQVHSRMAVVGATCSQTSFIKINQATFDQLTIRKEDCTRTIVSPVGHPYKPAPEEKTYQFELDLHITIDEVEEESGSLDVASIMAGVSTEMILLNKDKFLDMADTDGKPMIPLQKGDAFWTEISEDPRFMRFKLLELQSVYFILCENGKEDAPKAAIVCFNGDKVMFDIHVRHIQEVISAAAKVETGAAGEKKKPLQEAWTMFECVPVFAVYTPFRNIYSSMHDLDRKFDNKFDSMRVDFDSMRVDFDRKFDSMRVDFDSKLNAILEAINKSSQSKRSYWQRWLSRRANRDGV
jgi:hypothetical protein